MLTIFCASEIKLRTALDDDTAVLDKLFKNSLEGKRLRLDAIDKSDDIKVVRSLEVRVFVELVEHFLGICVTLEVDCNTQSLFV